MEPDTNRERIVQAAAALLAEGGRNAVSTRSVSAAAGVQAPTIYRLFGDMQGLLDAVTQFAFARYIKQKISREKRDDPVDELRDGWDLHIEYGVGHPAFYVLMYGQPQPGIEPESTKVATNLLREVIVRIAEAGKLKVSVERAVQMVLSASSGVTLRMIGTAEDKRDWSLPVQTREAIIAAIIANEDEASPESPLPARANALQAALKGGTSPLTTAETSLLNEWLERIADATES
jgi:AcrR family transcriptional regulator